MNLRKEKIDQDDFYKGLKTYSQDLLIELDRELSDVFPVAKDLLYHFIDSEPIVTLGELYKVMLEAGIDQKQHETIRNFLLYHGVIGLCLKGKEQYIFDVGYDLKQILIRVNRRGKNARFMLNPAFAPALGLKDQLHERRDII